MTIQKTRTDRSLTTAIALALALLSPALAVALDSEATPTAGDRADAATGGLVGALELGGSRPIGHVSGAQGDTIQGTFGDGAQLRLLGELGTRVSSSLRAGGYLGVDWGGTGARHASCAGASRVDCAAVSARLGASLQWRSVGTARLQPWLGYGMGALVTVLGDSRSGSHSSESLYGVELARASAGLDYALRKDLAIGLCVGYSLDLYLRRTGQAAQTGSLSDPTTHGWFSSGLRVSWI